MNRLELKRLDMATVIPLQKTKPEKVLRGGVITSDGSVERSSLLYRSFSQVVFSPKDRCVTPATIEGEYIYGGFLFDHFGHFILESLSRSWACREIDEIPIVFASSAMLKDWQADIFDVLGILDRIVVIHRPTRFKTLWLPEAGYRIQDFMHPYHAEFLGCFSSSLIEHDAKPIWLSRSALSADKRIAGEEKLEEVLRQVNWKIVCPETLSIREQLQLIASAPMVAGVEGSALHAAALIREFKGPLVVIRRLFNQNYRTISNAKGIVQYDFIGAIGRNSASDPASHQFRSPERSANLLRQLFDGLQVGDCSEQCRDPFYLPGFSIYQDDIEDVTSPFLGMTRFGGRAAVRTISATVRNRIKVAVGSIRSH